MKSSLYLLALVSWACARASKSPTAERHRGVPFARRSLYDGSEFGCLDGSGSIALAYVNDDYCDCADGSDEPGTSACPTGSFHCINLGHRGYGIPSSRVNDGLCDCCDGSDEWASGITCSNNCDEIGKAARADAERKAAEQRAGFAKRSELVKEATRLKEEKEKEVAAWQQEKEALDPEKDDLQMAKTEAETAEKAAKEAADEAWKAVKEAQRVAKAEAAFAILDADGNGILEAAELLTYRQFDKDVDGKVTLEEAQYYLLGKDQADKDMFIGDIWDGFKPIYEMRPGEADEAGPPVPGGERMDDAPPMPEDNGDEEEPGDDEVEDFDAEKYMKEGEKKEEEEEVQPDYDEDTKALIAKAEEARNAFDEADRKLRELDMSIKDGEEVLKTDFGPDNVFWPLKGQCVEMTESQYVYKFCPFEKATQRDKNSGGETNLGVWGEWAGPDDARYAVQKMSRGTACWNGPERSTMVRLSCGTETRLLTASEPGRCEYEFTVETPAACTDPASVHAADEL